ncbi:MAG: hypothetical protein L0216_06745 [Planctomycetales bacterium]|nr:hypothetical protein [Planctomycetales bacterium]
MLAVADIAGSTVAYAAAPRLWAGAARGHEAARAALLSMAAGSGLALLPGLLAFGLHVERQFRPGLTALEPLGDGAVLAVCGLPAIPALLAILALGHLRLERVDEPPAPLPRTLPRRLVRLAALVMAAASGVGIGREAALHPSRQPLPDTPEGWVERLRAGHPMAAYVLVQLGSRAAVPLAEALREDGEWRGVMSVAIDDAIAQSASRLPGWVTFRTRRPLTREPAECFGLFGAWGPESRCAIPALAECLGSSEVRWLARISLNSIRTVPEIDLPTLLAHAGEAPAARVAAAAAFARLAPAPTKGTALPVLEEGLAHPDAEVRGYAIDGLADLGATARHTLPALLTGHPEAGPEERVRALQAAQRIAPGDADAIRAIRAALDAPTIPSRDRLSLERDLLRASDLAPATLCAAASSGPTQTRTSALLHLNHRWASIPGATDILAAALRDPDPEIRAHTAAWCLDDGIPGIGSPREVLFACLRSSSPRDRQAAVGAAGYLDRGPADIREIVIAALDDSSPIVRREAIKTCLDNDWAAAEAMARLIAQTRAQNPRERWLALLDLRLQARGPGRATAERAALQAVQDPDPKVRCTALLALQWLRPRDY